MGVFTVSGSSLTVSNAAFDKTYATGYYGGAATFESGATGVFTDVSFTSASSYGQGGMVSVVSSTVSFTRTSMTTGRSQNGHGGCVHVESGTASFTDASFTSCSATYSYGGDGGGIFAESGSTINMNGGSFTSCLAQYDGNGGGLCLMASTATIVGPVAFDSCTAGNDGGGVYSSGAPISSVFTASTLTMSQFSVSFSSTTGAYSNGGGMYTYGSTVDLKNGSFTSNQAYYRAGGLYSASSVLTATNLTFTSNTASEDKGGGVYFNSVSDNQLNNVRFRENKGYVYPSMSYSDFEKSSSSDGVTCKAGCGNKGRYMLSCTKVPAVSAGGYTCESRSVGPCTVTIVIRP